MDLRLALTGFGNVGQGVATTLQGHGEEYRRRYGVRILLSGVADRGGGVIDPDGLDPAMLLQAKRRHGTVAGAPGGLKGLRGSDLVAGATAQILVEAASTNFEDAEPGWTNVQAALAGGMDIVLASKGALVLYWQDLMSRAQRAGCRVCFSATVGAPLPILELADRALRGMSITGFEGVLNSTTNHILASMAEGASYEEGVRQAQEIGIAETDPTLDVDGWDAAAKAVIVSNAVLGSNLRLHEVRREGIRQVSPADLRAAQRDGETIKLVVRGTRLDGGVRAEVRPEHRPLADALGRLRKDEMGVVLRTEPLGRLVATAQIETTGGVATALTVLRDVLNLAQDRGWAGT